MIINIVDNCVTTACRGPEMDHRVEALTANQPSTPHTIHPWHTCHTNKFSKEDIIEWKYKIKYLREMLPTIIIHNNNKEPHECVLVANLHIKKAGIPLEQKEIFENSKQYSSSLTDYTKRDQLIFMKKLC